MSPRAVVIKKEDATRKKKVGSREFLKKTHLGLRDSEAGSRNLGKAFFRLCVEKERDGRYQTVARARFCINRGGGGRQENNRAWEKSAAQRHLIVIRVIGGEGEEGNNKCSADNNYTAFSRPINR